MRAVEALRAIGYDRAAIIGRVVALCEVAHDQDEGQQVNSGDSKQSPRNKQPTEEDDAPSDAPSDAPFDAPSDAPSEVPVNSCADGSCSLPVDYNRLVWLISSK